MTLTKPQALFQVALMASSAHPKLRVRQLAFLQYVALNPGRTQTEIAEALGVSTSAISRNIDVFGTGYAKTDRHKSHGLVESLRDKADERLLLIYMTRKGERFLEDLADLLP